MNMSICDRKQLLYVQAVTLCVPLDMLIKQESKNELTSN